MSAITASIKKLSGLYSEKTHAESDIKELKNKKQRLLNKAETDVPARPSLEKQDTAGPLKKKLEEEQKKEDIVLNKKERKKLFRIELILICVHFLLYLFLSGTFFFNDNYLFPLKAGIILSCIICILLLAPFILTTIFSIIYEYIIYLKTLDFAITMQTDDPAAWMWEEAPKKLTTFSFERVYQNPLPNILVLLGGLLCVAIIIAIAVITAKRNDLNTDPKDQKTVVLSKKREAELQKAIEADRIFNENIDKKEEEYNAKAELRRKSNRVRIANELNAIDNTVNSLQNLISSTEKEAVSLGFSKDMLDQDSIALLYEIDAEDNPISIRELLLAYNNHKMRNDISSTRSSIRLKQLRQLWAMEDAQRKRNEIMDKYQRSLNQLNAEREHDKNRLERLNDEIEQENENWRNLK